MQREEEPESILTNVDVAVISAETSLNLDIFRFNCFGSRCIKTTDITRLTLSKHTQLGCIVFVFVFV